MAGPTYHAGRAWYPHDGHLSGCICTNTLVPSGAIGVALKLKHPFIVTSTNNAGFWWHGLSKLCIILLCSTKLHQCVNGNLSGKPANPDMK
eukprot:15360455-Ditylum_brightwellii.AAC.2